MTHKDTEPDTQELREQVGSIKTLQPGDVGDFEMRLDRVLSDEELQQLLALIAQREQAAELRGRIDELSRNRTWMKRLCDYVDEWDAMQEYDDRLATLQATKPEKGTDDGNSK